MEIKVLKNESGEVWLEFESGDLTIPALIASRLLERENIEFAGVRKDHPEVGKPLLVVKAKRNAGGELLKAIEELEDEIKSMESSLKKQ